MHNYKLTRRDFLKASGASLFLSGIPLPGFTSDEPPGNISVIILEGGMDGLTAVPPFGDPNLSKMRESLVPENYLKLNSFFGLHPSLKKLSSFMASNNASIVHATSFPYKKRSHFEGQNLVDSLSKAHNQESGKVFQKVKQKSMERLGNIPRDAESLAEYAGNAMSKNGGPVASVIRLDAFDTHASQGDGEGKDLGVELAKVDNVIAAYRRGLGSAWDRSIIMTITEFGRTVAMNGTWGTDHGYGTVGLLAGGAIKKSRVIAKWPGLAKNEQYEQRDLMATIDYRSVCAACIEKSLGLDHDVIASQVFFDSKLPRVFDYIFT